MKIRKDYEYLKIGLGRSLSPFLPFRNKILAVAVKSYAKADVKNFWSFQVFFGCFMSNYLSRITDAILKYCILTEYRILDCVAQFNHHGWKLPLLLYLYHLSWFKTLGQSWVSPMQLFLAFRSTVVVIFLVFLAFNVAFWNISILIFSSNVFCFMQEWFC